jgi:hypothetical protein
VLALHGRTVVSDPQPPHAEPPGEREVVVDGVAYRAGDKVRAAPRRPHDPYDRILDGRVATLERIYYDYDDTLYFGVTVDDDPGPGPDARHRALPVLLRRRGGGVHAMTRCESRSSSPDRQRVPARRRLRRRGRRRLRRATPPRA